MAAEGVEIGLGGIVPAGVWAARSRAAATVDQTVPGAGGKGEVQSDLAQIHAADQAGVLVGRGRSSVCATFGLR